MPAHTAPPVSRLALLALVLAGCTHVQPAPLSTPEGRAAVTDRAVGKTVTLVFAGGESARAYAPAVAADSVTWWDAEGGGARSAPTAALAEVRFVDRGRGAFEGLGLGFAVGAGFGAALGTLVGLTDGGGFLSLTPVEGALLGAAGWGQLGAGVGLVGGLDRGSQAVYRPAPAAVDATGAADGRAPRAGS